VLQGPVLVARGHVRSIVLQGPVLVARGHVRSIVLQGPVLVARGHVRSIVLQGPVLVARGHVRSIVLQPRACPCGAGADPRGKSALVRPGWSGSALARGARRCARARTAGARTARLPVGATPHPPARGAAARRRTIRPAHRRLGADIALRSRVPPLWVARGA